MGRLRVLELRLRLSLNVLMLFAVAGYAAAAAPAPAPLRVLFAGNSHTARHALPDLVRRVAAARGHRMDVGMLAAPGTAIIDHVESGELEQALEGGWDWLVLQQGPSTRSGSRVILVEGAQEAMRLARVAGTRVALMSVWPPVDDRGSGARGEAHYAEAARATGACLIPAATAWRLASLRASQLYDRDRVHAGAAGALLAAMVVADGLLGASSDQRAVLAQALPGRRWARVLAQLDQLTRASHAARQSGDCLPKSAG